MRTAVAKNGRRITGSLNSWSQTCTAAATSSSNQLADLSLIFFSRAGEGVLPMPRSFGMAERQNKVEMNRRSERRRRSRMR